mmetsp:Transcript_44808/g.136804  ORF Transcript_44808/g.136804 Transcript_44808/m.136804 type:complete len:238 (-) Transcript_44808:2841-3554(-)
MAPVNHVRPATNLRSSNRLLWYKLAPLNARAYASARWSSDPASTRGHSAAAGSKTWALLHFFPYLHFDRWGERKNGHRFTFHPGWPESLSPTIQSGLPSLGGSAALGVSRFTPTILVPSPSLRSCARSLFGFGSDDVDRASPRRRPLSGRGDLLLRLPVSSVTMADPSCPPLLVGRSVSPAGFRAAGPTTEEGPPFPSSSLTPWRARFDETLISYDGDFRFRQRSPASAFLRPVLST